MGIPPDFLLTILQPIESVTIRIHKEFPTLVDNDVEWVYDQMLNYFKARISDKNTEEPLSSMEKRQALIDEILNVLDEREEAGKDRLKINNPAVTNGGNVIPSLEILYSLAFKTLRNSARFWRKKKGSKGYLAFIEPFL